MRDPAASDSMDPLRAFCVLVLKQTRVALKPHSQRTRAKASHMRRQEDRKQQFNRSCLQWLVQEERFADKSVVRESTNNEREIEVGIIVFGLRRS